MRMFLYWIVRTLEDLRKLHHDDMEFDRAVQSAYRHVENAIGNWSDATSGYGDRRNTARRLAAQAEQEALVLRLAVVGIEAEHSSQEAQVTAWSIMNYIQARFPNNHEAMQACEHFAQSLSDASKELSVALQSAATNAPLITTDDGSENWQTSAFRAFRQSCRLAELELVESLVSAIPDDLSIQALLQTAVTVMADEMHDTDRAAQSTSMPTTLQQSRLELPR